MTGAWSLHQLVRAGLELHPAGSLNALVYHEAEGKLHVTLERGHDTQAVLQTHSYTLALQDSCTWGARA